jgi:hypothetical protein
VTTQAGRIVVLPVRGLSRVGAAQYMGIGPTKFDRMVHDGRAPRPRRIDGRLVYDIRELDEAFDRLPRADGTLAEAPSSGDIWDRMRL